MLQIKVEHYCVGIAGTNCYFVINTAANDIVIIDPGAQAQKLADFIKAKAYKPAAILLTHGHFDHILAVKELADLYQIQIYAHEAEQKTLMSPDLNLTGIAGESQAVPADVYLQDGQELLLGGIRMVVLHTPGHTDGGCCYYLEEQKMLFSGDTLFHNSIGRTDFPNGSMSKLVRAIKEKLLTLPDDVMVYPGHMEFSSIGEERSANPFL